MKQIPYFVHEGIVARMERVNRRLMIVAVIEGAAVVIGIVAALKKNAD